MSVSFTVPGAPVPKGRPRTYIDHFGRSRTFTPKRTKAFEDQVGWEAKAARAHRISGDVEVLLRFYGSRADGDNLAKSVLDGLQGVVLDDDAQVVALHVHVVRDGEPPRTEVTVRLHSGWAGGAA